MQIGEITSGAYSPCLKKNVAMGYVEKKYGKAGTQLKVQSAPDSSFCASMFLHQICAVPGQYIKPRMRSS